MRPNTLGPYRLGEPLGKGGMGTVYDAVHSETGERVALKVLSPRLAVAEGFRDRFEGEIESLKSLRHAGIVRLLGYGEEDGVLFYAMELIDGPSLEEELRNGRRFDWRETTAIAIQICRSLKHAHDHGVIHRDLKPANILLAPNGQPKLADFGIARVFGSTGMTMAGGVLGTADYMSPEQAAGKPVNARCDQYCLAGVLYALLTGRPPFRATDMASMLQLQRFAIPEPVRRFAPDTPQDLERIVAKMLEKDPADRFPNTMVIARRLEAMTQALARVAADDFEIYQTEKVVEPSGPKTESDELAIAVTRDAVETQALTDSFVAEVAEDEPTVVASRYTHVDPLGEDGDAPSRASTVIGQSVVLAIALGTIGAIGWWLFRPLTADGLHQRLGDRVRAGSVDDSTLDAVRDFTQRFPEDPRGEEVAEWGRSLRLEQLRRRMKLNRRRGGNNNEMSPEESLMTRATRLAADNPTAGAEAFDHLAELFGTGDGPPAGRETPAAHARQEAAMIRQAESDDRRRLAEYADKKLQAVRDRVAGDPAAVAAVCRAVLASLPEGPETQRTRADAEALLASLDDAPAVASDGAVR